MFSQPLGQLLAPEVRFQIIQKGLDLAIGEVPEGGEASGWGGYSNGRFPDIIGGTPIVRHHDVMAYVI
jgi:hypothetical protein